MEEKRAVSRELVLQLMALPDASSRANALRDTITATPSNNHKAIVEPSELLEAIAYHAQSWRADCCEKMNELQQVAVIARLVIMKLCGSNSPELRHFEDGLKPAMRKAGLRGSIMLRQSATS